MLITLGIIGIVAAMTMPILVGKYKKQVTVTQLKKAYTVLSQMVLQAQEDNGPVYFSNSQVNAVATENFFKLYWLPYFNNPTVAKEGIYPYGTDAPFVGLNGQKGSGVQTNYAAGRIFFTTSDGTAYSVNMMQWKVEYDEDGNEISSVPVYRSFQEVTVDLNGFNPPNIYGRDVFIFQVFFDNSVVKPNGYNANMNLNCSFNGGGQYCAAKIMQDGWEIKDDYPW